jgi:hypothetical protein
VTPETFILIHLRGEVPGGHIKIEEFTLWREKAVCLVTETKKKYPNYNVNYSIDVLVSKKLYKCQNV